MEEDFSDDIVQFFMEWCIVRGFTLETPRIEMVKAIVDELEQHIQEAEARRDEVIKIFNIDGSISFETIEEAKEILKDFKHMFGLE